MSSSRLSLHDCAIDLRLPGSNTHAPTSQDAANVVTKETLSTPKPDDAEAYIGSSLHVLLTVSLPSSAPEPVAALLASVAEPLVSLISPDGASVRLPVIAESSWLVVPGLPTDRSSASAPTSPQPVPPTPQSHHASPHVTGLSANSSSSSASSATSVASASRMPHTLVKSLWLVVKPADNATTSHTRAHVILLSLRERLAPVRNSPVWATIDRASRLFSKTPALQARKPLQLVSPLHFAVQTHAPGGADNEPVVSVVVRNITSDAVLAVCPPVLALAASTASGALATAEATAAAGTADAVPPLTPARQAGAGTPGRRRPGSPKPRTGLPGLRTDNGGSVTGSPRFRDVRRRMDEFYEAVALHDRANVTTEEDGSSSAPSDIGNGGSGGSGSGGGGSSSSSSNSSNNSSGGADGAGDDPVELAPRHIVSFAFRLRRKLGARDAAPRHEVDTPVTVAWSVGPVLGPTLRRASSVTSILASGRRTFAARTASFRWEPELSGVVTSFTGPAATTVGRDIGVSVTIVNGTETTLRSAQLSVRCGGLLPVHSVVSVGSMPPGAATTVRVACRALWTGVVSFGGVAVLAEVDDSGKKEAWVARKDYSVLAVDDGAAVLDDDPKLLESLVIR